VLDIGTGGGEQFLRLVPLIGAGTGIDASTEMVAAARAGTPADLAGKVSFEVMDAGRLELPGAKLRPGAEPARPVYAAEIVRVLRPGGVFITQQVGGRNTQSIFSTFGWQSNAALRETTTQPLTRLPCQTKCMPGGPGGGIRQARLHDASAG